MSDNDLSIPSPPEFGRGGRISVAAGPLLVTGMSGAGRTTALKCLEDIGYEAVDNVPIALLGGIALAAGTTPGGDRRPVAVGIDIRSRDFGIEAFLVAAERLEEEAGHEVRLLFLDCDDDAIRRRYAETRHRHPLAQDRPLADGVRHERRLLMPLRDRADLVVDTTEFSPADLERAIRDHFTPDRAPGLSVSILSFGFTHGLPHGADLVFDVRFLRNPHYVAELRPLTGREAAVAEYVADDDGFASFIEGLTGLLEVLLPRYAAEGRPCLTIALGCTGGRHRSIVAAERLGAWMREKGFTVDVRHRDG